MGGQECAHVLLGDGSKLAPEFGVQRADGGERVADEVGELHVDDPMSGQRLESRSFMPRSRPTTISSHDCAAQSAIELSSDASRRRWWVSALIDEMTLSGSRWVCTISASGYSATSASSCHRCAGDFSSH